MYIKIIYENFEIFKSCISSNNYSTRSAFPKWLYLGHLQVAYNYTFYILLFFVRVAYYSRILYRLVDQSKDWKCDGENWSDSFVGYVRFLVPFLA